MRLEELIQVHTYVILMSLITATCLISFQIYTCDNCYVTRAQRDRLHSRKIIHYVCLKQSARTMFEPQEA